MYILNFNFILLIDVMDDTTILKISDKIKNSFLTTQDYNFDTDHNDDIILTSNVVIYNTGNLWKVISIDVCLSYPIIHDKYQSNDEEFDITFILCPVTLRSIYLKGRFEFLTYDNKCKMILREIENKDTLITIDHGTKIDKKYIIQSNKRSEVKITTLRNALTFLPDALFLNLNKTKKINYIVNKSYYTNGCDINGVKLTEPLIHPKTLVYLIQYKSQNNHKTTIILGKDISNLEVTGYDAKQSKIFDYIDVNKSVIIKKEGFIMPILWHTSKILYPDAKYVYVSK